MSKSTYISRYSLLLKKLKQSPYSSYEVLKRYIEHHLEYLQGELQIGFSKRTLQRDIREIRELFGIDITYSKSEKGYFINQSEAENMNFQRMIEAFDMFNSLNFSHDLKPYIHLEKRRPQGTEHLYGLLHAIKNRFQIKFAYQKYWEDEISQRLAEPYALKEFKNRWYILAKDKKDEAIKTFALDRLSNLEISTRIFEFPSDFDIEKRYRYFFGIINPENEKLYEIILSFNAFQGKYIKSLPLHSSQKVLVDTEEELQIKLTLCITHDFIMELLSYGDNLKVLQPQLLVDEIKDAHHRAYMQYE